MVQDFILSRLTNPLEDQLPCWLGFVTQHFFVAHLTEKVGAGLASEIMIKRKESDIKQKAVIVTKDIIFILARGERKKGVEL